MHPLVYIGCYFNWMLPLDLPSLIFRILVFHVRLTIHLCGHSAYKMYPLWYVSIRVITRHILKILLIFMSYVLSQN